MSGNVDVAFLVMYLMISEIAETLIDTKYGSLLVTLCKNGNAESCLVASASPTNSEAFIRIHSACLFGEILCSELCECQHQLNAALEIISERGGWLFYLFQEGRGLGLLEKICAMEVERREGISTVDAFQRLGYPTDIRDYGIAIAAMRRIGVPRVVQLMTNNPKKIAAVESEGYVISERVEPRLRVSAKLARAVRRKQEALGHIPYASLDIED